MAKTDKTKFKKPKKPTGNVKSQAKKRTHTISGTTVVQKKAKLANAVATRSAFAAYKEETKDNPGVKQVEPKKKKQSQKKQKKGEGESVTTTKETINLEKEEIPENETIVDTEISRELNESCMTEDLIANSSQMSYISADLDESCATEDADVDVSNPDVIEDEETPEIGSENFQKPNPEIELETTTESKGLIKEVDDGDIAILHLTPDSSHVLLAICEDHSGVKIFGQGAVKAVKGCAEILGHEFHSGDEAENFYAPLTHCALVIQPLKREFSSPDIFSNLASSGIDLNDDIRERVEKLSERFEVVFLISSLRKESGSVSFAEYPSIFQVRKGDEIVRQKLNPKNYVVTTDNAFIEYPCYRTAVATLLADLRLCKSDRNMQHPVIFTCGGKNAGKSTFNRYLINKLLRECGRVCYLECDVGQTEFTPSGILSLVSVSTPLLGPPYIHQSSPSFAVYYGDVSPARDPDRYVESVRRVFEEFDHTCPLVVNTMGWTKALGLRLIVDSIRILKPTHILQLVSQKQSRNLPLLTTEYVADAEGWLCRDQIEAPDHKLLTMNVEIHIFEKIIYRPSDMRDLAFLSYLNQIVNTCFATQRHATRPQSSSMAALCSVKPYIVNMADVKLCVAHRSGVKRTHALAAFNASIVGLSISTESSTEQGDFLPGAPICQCLGLGIVRGVDPQKEVLYVVSHLPAEEMNRVNCLVLGALCIPETLFQDGGKKKSTKVKPYIMEESWFDVIGSNKFRIYRNYQPAKT